MTNAEAVKIVEDTQKWLSNGCKEDQPHNHIKTEKAFDIFLELIRELENDNGWDNK
jgi:hypothetical protein